MAEQAVFCSLADAGFLRDRDGVLDSRNTPAYEGRKGQNVHRIFEPGSFDASL